MRGLEQTAVAIRTVILSQPCCKRRRSPRSPRDAVCHAKLKTTASADYRLTWWGGAPAFTENRLCSWVFVGCWSSFLGTEAQCTIAFVFVPTQECSSQSYNCSDILQEKKALVKHIAKCSSVLARCQVVYVSLRQSGAQTGFDNSWRTDGRVHESEIMAIELWKMISVFSRNTNTPRGSNQEPDNGKQMLTHQNGCLPTKKVSPDENDTGVGPSLI